MLPHNDMLGIRPAAQQQRDKEKHQRMLPGASAPVTPNSSPRAVETALFACEGVLAMNDGLDQG